METAKKAKSGKNKKLPGVDIANPVYDVVFKYLLEDNAIAKLIVSSIIGENVVTLKAQPQERTIAKAKAEGENPLTVYRLDFAATIRTETGTYKLVTIEMQKAGLPTDIKRFRRYLGDRYTDETNYTDDNKAMQIYTIYFLGKDLGICDTPVLCVFPEIRDLSNPANIIQSKSEFIESLNHKCWIVQINCLKERRRNELEQLLSVFDQSNLTKDVHILNVNEEDFPEKFRSVIRRLKAAASDRDVKKMMREEDGFLDYMKTWLHNETKRLEKALAEQAIALDEKDKALAKQANAIDEKDKALDEKDKAIAELRKQIADLHKG